MVGTTECPSKLAWGATESEPSNIHDAHNRLGIRLRDEITEKEFKDVKQMFRGHFGSGELDKMNDICDLFNRLFDRQELKYGNYEILKRKFAAIGLYRLNECINETCSEIRNLREQPAAMHQSNENVGNVPNRSQESPLHYSVQLEDIIGLLSQSLAQQREMLQEYQKTIQELRLEKKEMQQEYQKTIQELRLEKKEMQQEYQKAEKERDEMMAKLRKEMTKEREEYLKKMKQLNDKLAYKEDYARRLKNRGFFCRLFNLEPL